MDHDSHHSVKGVLFRRSIRSSHALLEIAVKKSDVDAKGFDPKEYHPISIFLEFGTNKQMRSDIRRFCRISDLIEANGIFHLDTSELNVEDLSSMTLKESNHWNVLNCQKMNEFYYPKPKAKQESNSKKKSKSNHHSGGGIGKRKQGEIVADFFMNCMSKKFSNAIQSLNEGSGVMDIAGGSGHVSLALSLMGIQSTIMDPRESVGKLPMRDRKAFRKAKRNYEQQGQQCIPVIPPPLPFAMKRAWFLQKPQGVDSTYRENDTVLPVCGICDPLLSNCSAIIALHPDEATESIVDFAIQFKIPFVIVPCCVFSRLFPMRIWKGLTVTKYEDFIDYLLSKHKSIQKSKLDFEGSNIALWSLFL